MLPPDDQLTLCFAHVAYRFAERYAQRGGRLKHFEVRSLEELEARIGEADVLLVSGMWRNHLAAKAPRLKFIQSISAGVDQYDKAVLAGAGIRLASAQGANANAVSEHAMSLILAQARLLPQARDNQVKQHWRGMIGDLTQREDELGGKTLLVVGIGRIGGRLARLAKAFDMKVIGLRQDPAKGSEGADEIHGMDQLHAQLARADIVALCCALTPETRGLMNAAAFAAMKPGATLVNVARGAVCDEAALIAALSSGQLGQAALDVTVEEPLAAASPLWTLPNVFITPHTGGETRAYEGNVLDLLEANLPRLRAGEKLVNQVV
ncbi:D-2-hydroxyacid dehydrogenase [Falsiroseomonas tokyonensis]|uniref:D-2-hydroxyacid dehydrogenase n=1 Tax=Falsiroseomonas tokyonensis TaxID=430521 RepID=A0ABV7BU48_9PROT|nr:D-2-hydroxyacid dehydrogenase [Falsiroseomonas tokyonensis]MBU8539128.1 D-2-hydroxyacid dehydrogenase [Falsiroseomonas tokyonensis]